MLEQPNSHILFSVYQGWLIWNVGLTRRLTYQFHNFFNRKKTCFEYFLYLHVPIVRMLRIKTYAFVGLQVEGIKNLRPYFIPKD